MERRRQQVWRASLTSAQAGNSLAPEPNYQCNFNDTYQKIKIGKEKRMDLKLKDKVALVTGSSSGIGESIAKTLAAEGATVIVHGRNEERAKRVADEINRGGGKAFTVVGDLS